jgi:hypothetical protein
MRVGMHMSGCIQWAWAGWLPLAGITCRWASKHRHADPLVQQAQQQEAHQQVGASEPPKDAPATEAPAAEAPAPRQTDGQGAANGTVEQRAGEAAAMEGSAVGAEAPRQGPQQTQHGGGGAEQGAQLWWRQDGSIPGRVVGPLTGEELEESMNSLCKSLQSILRWAS